MFRLLKPYFKHDLESTLSGTRLAGFLSEFLGNSGHFLILKSLADIALYGWQEYFTDPTEYLLVGAMVAQSVYLSKPHPSRLFGNVLGVTLYTLVDLPIDGGEFFQNPSHGVFWIFSLAIAILQSSRYHWKSTLELWTIPLESVVRMLMVLAFYVVVRAGKSANQPANQRIVLDWFQTFISQNTHAFLATSLVLIGLLLGFQQLQIVTQQRQLKQTAKLLKKLAKWGMGSHAVNTAVMNPEGLEFEQCDRAIVFMDIRGFTVWCEHNEPKIVASTLNRYYQQLEPVVSYYHPLRITFTADEIMAIYATPEQAVDAAQAMQKTAAEVLSPYQIGAGCAVHYGTVVEGLFGGEDVRTYTVIGDVVNTAKRLEGATPAGEVMISDAVYQKLDGQVEVKYSTRLELKGKAEPLTGWMLRNPKLI